ncbi:MAG: hypothetical protein JO359_01970, partial [Candidatus Eremiobacteraeota bacterium]|nr:hypothetical protein [Candidatus Eremiobacteraeota bacterium]
MKGPATLAVLLLFAAPASAQTAGGPAVLRHLAYDVRSSSTLRKDERQSGLSYVNVATHQVVGTPSGGNFDSAQHSERNAGRLDIEIVAATRDGGLVADVTLTGTTTSLGKTRISIMSDGRLGYDPSLELPPELRYVLPFLGRGVIAGHAVGDSWKIPLEGRNVRGEDAFRILSDAGNDRVNVELVTTMHTSGTRLLDESS